MYSIMCICLYGELWSYFCFQFEDLKLESRRTHQDAKDEILKLETSYSGVKKELEILRVEHEKHIAANDQAVPQNK